jgi:hypothetical protein
LYWRSFKKDFVTIIDPSGINRSQTDESTCAESLCKAGFSPQPGPITWEERRSSVEHYLLKFVKSGPCFQINENHCPTLVQGFKGGYQYPKSAMEIEPLKARPIKNVFSHCHDAAQYVASWARDNSKKEKKAKIPGVRYSFMEKNKP